MATTLPGVSVKQAFTPTAVEYDSALSAWIVGPNAILHRYAEADEKDAIRVGAYADMLEDGLTTSYPGISAGGRVDTGYVKVYVEDAYLGYYKLNVPATPSLSGTTPFAYNEPGTSNCITCHALNLKTNGAYARDAVFGNRDVQIGDTVTITGYAPLVPGSEDCSEATFETEVLDYVVDQSEGAIGKIIRVKNPATTSTVTLSFDTAEGDTAAPVITQTAGTTYTGTLAEEVYTVSITPTEDSFTYSVTSASGLDNYPTAVEPTAISGDAANVEITVGSKGLKLTAPATVASWNFDTIEVAVRSNVVTVSSANACVLSTTSAYTTGGANVWTITGSYDPRPSGMLTQTYRVQVTKKTSTSSCTNLVLNITSQSGTDDRDNVQATLSDSNYTFDLTGDGSLVASMAESDFSSISIGDSWLYTLSGSYAPVVFTASGNYAGDADDTYVVKCVHGGCITSSDVNARPQVMVFTARGTEYLGPITVGSSTLIETANGINLAVDVTGGNSSRIDMAYGEVYQVSVLSGANKAVRTIMLRDSLPTSMRTYSASNIAPLAVQFGVRKTLRLAESTGASTNYVLNANDTITLRQSIQIADPDFTNLSGVVQNVSLLDGDVYVEYREFVPTKARVVNKIISSDGLDSIPGQLSPDNPLKYGVYKALANSNGTVVAYTAVDGDTADAWEEAFAAGAEDGSVYSVVPMTDDITVQNLAVARATSDSDEELCAWKHAIVSVPLETRWMVVGQSDSNALTQTSLDGEAVFATISENSSTHRYTEVEITSRYNGRANADLTQVTAGDVLYVFGGSSTPETYTINRVNGDTLSLLSGPDAATVIPMSIQIWHNATKDEQAERIVSYAQSFASPRVLAVYPSVIGEGSLQLPGYFLCAAIGGLLSGLSPYAGATRVTIQGFDDFSLSKPYFNTTQLKALVGGGVWVCIENESGTTYTLKAVTTDTTDLNSCEEMVVRNMDAISFELRALLDNYIGKYVITDQILSLIASRIDYRLEAMTRNGQLTAYEGISVTQDSLLKDTIIVGVTVSLPYAINSIRITITA